MLSNLCILALKVYCTVLEYCKKVSLCFCFFQYLMFGFYS